jgi:hypothetical protein
MVMTALIIVLPSKCYGGFHNLIDMVGLLHAI